MEQKNRAKEIIEAAAGEGRRALSEHEAKEVLAAYGVPVTREVLAKTVDEAVLAAAEMGYPVVLKACSSTIMHKSEGGLVAVNLTGEEELRRAFDRISGALSAPIDGMLVQEMVMGRRELVVGMNRDPQFGPCVMLGLGGVMTEVFKDTAFRMAPIDPVEAEDMAAQLRCAKIFGPFRGEKPVDRNSLFKCLYAAGQIGLEWEQVAEIDINPLIVSADGGLKAVDALVVLS